VFAICICIFIYIYFFPLAFWRPTYLRVVLIYFVGPQTNIFIYPASHFLSAFLWPQKAIGFFLFSSLFITERTHTHTPAQPGEN